MSEHPRYIIKMRWSALTPADILKIPQEKVEHALKDFADWIDTNHAFAALAKAYPALVAVEVDLSEFKWVDDEKHEIIPTFEIKGPAGEARS